MIALNHWLPSSVESSARLIGTWANHDDDGNEDVTKQTLYIPWLSSTKQQREIIKIWRRQVISVIWELTVVEVDCKIILTLMRAKIFPMNASHVQTKHQKQQFTFKFFKKSNLLVLSFCSAGVWDEASHDTL